MATLTLIEFIGGPFDGGERSVESVETAPRAINLQLASGNRAHYELAIRPFADGTMNYAYVFVSYLPPREQN